VTLDHGGDERGLRLDIVLHAGSARTPHPRRVLGEVLVDLRTEIALAVWLAGPPVDSLLSRSIITWR
jgi:hypothetical protein